MKPRLSFNPSSQHAASSLFASTNFRHAVSASVAIIPCKHRKNTTSPAETIVITALLKHKLVC
jgi:hypothetical protein